MPLSKAARRKHLHTREITCKGYQRDDGLWDIEGSLVDTKTYDFDNEDRDGISAGEPVHHMLVRLTVDDDFVVQSAEAVTESGPFHICGEAAQVFPKLEGLTIGKGWRANVKQVMGGAGGCTHLRDLIMGPLAVTAYQTIMPARKKSGPPKVGFRPRLLNTCHAFREDGPIVAREWPDWHKGQKDGAKTDSAAE